MPYGLSYPDASLEPNIETVTKVAADLAVIYFEFECYINGSHPFPDRISKLIQSRKTPHSSGENLIKNPQVKVLQEHRTISSGYGSLELNANNDRLNPEQLRQYTMRSSTISEEPNNFFTPISGEIIDKSSKADIDQWLTPPTSPKTVPGKYLCIM